MSQRYSLRVKHLYLVRHAESDNNVDKAQTRSLLKLDHIPSIMQIKHMLNLLKFDFDSPLSDRGRNMLEIQKKILHDRDFIHSRGIQVILHSDLQRAKDTCNGLFGNLHGQIPIRSHPLLYEQSFSEHLTKDIMDRVKVFKREIFNLDEDRIVLVGHSGFFRRLYQSENRMRNCEVRYCVLREDGIVQHFETLFEGGDSLFVSPEKSQPDEVEDNEAEDQSASITT